ncbi:hypothetical protein D3C72_1530110 [compost metagenome]
MRRSAGISARRAAINGPSMGMPASRRLASWRSAVALKACPWRTAHISKKSAMPAIAGALAYHSPSATQWKIGTLRASTVTVPSRSIWSMIDSSGARVCWVLISMGRRSGRGRRVARTRACCFSIMRRCWRFMVGIMVFSV